MQALLKAAFKGDVGIREVKSKWVGGGRVWLSEQASSECSVSSGLQSSRGHIRRAVLTVRALMSLLYTSPGKKTRRFSCFIGEGVVLF